MTDLLKTLGQKEPKSSAEGTGSPAPQSTAETKQAAVESNKSESAATGQNNSAEGRGSNAPNTSSKVEPAGTVTEPDTWTKESALKEVKKAREEAKAVRIKYEESVEKLKQEMEARLSAREKEVEEFRNAQKELSELKEKEADKKRDLSEKLAHRESLVSELKTKLDMTTKQHQDEMLNLKAAVEQFKAKEEAQRAVQEKRVQEELATIPDKFKDLASIIVKGAGDPGEALLAISEAKIKGVFEDKTIIVNHSVPGAADGARATKERFEAANQETRSKMSGLQKIGQALKDMKTTPNSAFRTHKS